MLTKAILGRGKGQWHLDGYDGEKPLVINLKPIREFLENCSDGTVVYDAKMADTYLFNRWCVYGPAFSLDNTVGFLESLCMIPGVSFGTVKNGRIICKMRADCVEAGKE